MSETTPNARFWVWVNGGNVKLTLKPGQRLVHNEGGPDEEGYSYTQEAWKHEGRYVTRCWTMQAKDCDGRIDRFDRSRYKVADMITDYAYKESSDIQHRPEWENTGGSQRDYSAEAAGY